MAALSPAEAQAAATQPETSGWPGAFFGPFRRSPSPTQRDPQAEWDGMGTIACSSRINSTPAFASARSSESLTRSLGVSRIGL